MEMTYHLPHAGVQMLQKSTNSIVLLPRRSSFNSRPLSEATEILDTDFEAEFSDIESPRRSVDSFENDTSTTLSTPDELPTPSALETAFSLGFDANKPVQGPSGPHLFRSSLDASISGRSDDEWHLPLSSDALEDARRTPILWNERIFDPKPSPREFRPGSAMSMSRVSPQQDIDNVRAWTPAQVAEWMYEAGLEDMVVERFIENDISGAVLLDLQIEDLKELNIQSFGKRHGLMNMIQNLRAGTPSRPSETPLSRMSRSRSSSMRRTGSNDHTVHSPISEKDATRPSGRRNRVVAEKDVISPGESISIVAIEQLIPRPHKCSKGENCPKFLKRQRKIARIAREFPNEFAHVNDNLVSVQLTSPVKSENGLRPKSDVTPSLVASSDVLGPAQMPELKLSAENLNGVQPRDPQENVRQFLNFQHIHNPIGPEQDQPQLEMFPPLAIPPAAAPTVNMANQLRSLPKLMIPRCSSVNDAFSPDRTITPSRGSRLMGSATATQETNPFQFGQDVLRHVTPFSEMDVPVTAMPLEPLDRDASQSVPPNMRYGNFQQPTIDPIYRPPSARPDHHRRRPSFATMAPLTEERVLPPINNPSELRRNHSIQIDAPQISPSHSAPDSGQSSTAASKDNDVAHSGWMKKRKTRLLRHEWHDAHFTLKGTVLAMHKDERDSRALETIDVDDYAVACSSLASNSKLTAAFKRSALRKAANLSRNGSSYKGADETAFAFSLVPAAGEKRSLFLSSGKSHHFAVKTRDERINWMRELMLAKALKKGKEGGNEICVNGNMI